MQQTDEVPTLDIGSPSTTQHVAVSDKLQLLGDSSGNPLLLSLFVAYESVIE